MKKFIILVIVVWMVTACGAQPAAAPVETVDTPANSAAPSISYPMTVAHDTGETTIENRPERVVVVGEYAMELLLVLDQQPVGVAVLPQIVSDAESGQPVTKIDYYNDYFTELPIFVGGFQEPSLEAMVAANPDLIVAHSFPAGSKLDDFSQVAPTLEYDFLGQDGWQRFIGPVGQTLEAEDVAEAYIADFEARLVEATDQLEPLLAEGNRLNFVTFFGPDIFLFSEQSSVAQLFQQLGMTWALPPGVTIDPNGFSPTSLEAVATTEADLTLIHNYGAPPETVVEVTRLLESVTPGKVFVLDYSAEPFLGVAGPISERIFLDRTVALLTQL